MANETSYLLVPISSYYGYQGDSASVSSAASTKSAASVKSAASSKSVASSKNKNAASSKPVKRAKRVPSSDKEEESEVRGNRMFFLISDCYLKSL